MDLPGDWFQRDAKRIKEEVSGWPDWMKAGVQESIDRAERRMLDYDKSNQKTR